MNRTTVIALTLGTTVAASLGAVRRGVTHEAPVPAADSVRRSSDWLSLLPEGEEKRRFILDCTGCHQIDDQIVRPNGRPRTQAELKEMVDKMLGFAGSTTGFPVIGHGRESVSTAAWMARNFFANPTIRPRGTLPPNARVTEYDMPEAGDLPHDVAVGRDGRIVVTGMFSHRMWVLDPTRGTFDGVDIPIEKANPRALEIDAAGDWWVVFGARHMIGRYSPTSRTWRTWPGGFYPHSLALAPDGGVWINGHFTHSPEWAQQVFADVVQRLQGVGAGHIVAHAGRLVVCPQTPDSPGGNFPGSAVNAQEHVVTSDIQWALSSGATAFPKSHFLADRQEGRYLASVEQDGKWFGVSKVVLTTCLARGMDAVIGGVPASLLARLRLTCPEIVTAASHS